MENRLKRGLGRGLSSLLGDTSKKISANKIYLKTKIDKWFIEQIKEIVDIENVLIKHGFPKTANELNYVKSIGFSDVKIAELTKKKLEDVKMAREKLGVISVYKKIDTCAAEFKSLTPYMYSTYQRNFSFNTECEADPSNKKKIIILGGGPNRIGQGIEFDYCCVHAVYGLKELGIETIMINCNPETVSTDYDTADRLYFEPLTAESVIEIYNKENSNGKVLGVYVQFGGQTPLKIAKQIPLIDFLSLTIKIVDAISFPRIMLDVLIGCARRNSRVFSFLSKHIVDIVMNGENRTPRKQQSRRRTVIGPSFQFPGVEKGSE